MADRIKRAAAWLGLVTDDRYDYDADDAEYTSDVEYSDPGASVTPLEDRRSAPSTRAAELSRIITVHPRTYNEARSIGENFRDGIPVIMNLSEMADADAKRLVDFSAVLIFGVRGSIERITSKVFLLSPPNVNVTAEDKERIAGGFFNQS